MEVETKGTADTQTMEVETNRKIQTRLVGFFLLDFIGAIGNIKIFQLSDRLRMCLKSC